MSIDLYLDQLHQVATSPKKQLDNYLAQGKKVVAVAPVYTPLEIIHAMGLVPMGVWGADTEIQEAKRYYPAFICSVLQSVLELGIKGAYEGVSAIVIPALCDSLRTLGQNWSYGVESIPYIPIIYPQNRTPAYGAIFTKESYQRMIQGLEATTGARFSEPALRRSILVYNKHNQVMRDFAVLAGTAGLTPSQRNDVFKSAWFMLPEEHTQIVSALNEALKSSPKKADGIPVAITGIMADCPDLLKSMADNGMYIVYDDMASDSRQYRTDAEDREDSLQALAEKFSNMDHCSVLYDPQKKRVNYVVDQAKANGAKCLIFLMTKFCDPEEFDYVPMKRACEAAGLAHLSIEVDRQMTQYGQAATMLQAFQDTL